MLWVKTYHEGETEQSGVTERFTTPTKQQMLAAISELPEAATFDDALHRLLLLEKIEQGLDEARSGLTLLIEGVRQQLSR
jgi:hypothetical protein